MNIEEKEKAMAEKELKFMESMKGRTMAEILSHPESKRLDEERKALVEKNPAYGRIICRCETITEGEILDAIRAPAGARDVDGVKRRTRAGMGRCQGGFCGSKVVELLARELGVELNEITKFGGDSKIIYERTK